ncbi:MAG: HAMP domain-containing protein [Myxococcales bacterium]|nr:HAMP domain-containing protein [Myxococcales bacterium]
MSGHEASASTVAPVRLLSRPSRAASPELPPPPPGRLLRVFIGAIAIGQAAAVVGAYYITLAVTFPPGALALFLAVLAVLVGASIGAVYLVHRRLSGRIAAWLARPGDGVDRGAWRQALNYPVHLAVAVGLSALLVSAAAALVLAAVTRDLVLAFHIAVGGGLASVLDAIFAWLYTDYALRPLRRVMAVREPLLPVSGYGIVHLGLGAKMAVVIVGVSLVSAVVVGTLAYRAATEALHSGDLAWLAVQLILVTVIGLVVSLSGCLLVTRHTTEPLRELTTLVAELTPERYSQRGVPMSADEVGQLTWAVNAMLGGLEERDFIKDAFSRYVTRQVSDVVLQGGLELGGELLTATILMADIRDFTGLSERMPPRQVVRLLNRYFTEMVEECMEHGGMIDKFIGDAIMVVFGAPARLTPEQSARAAAKAALGMHRRLAALNAAFAADGLPALRIGIGIHTGEAIAGNIGSPQRLDYTLIGDSVNTTARIESTCKEVDHDLLVSEATRAHLGDRARIGEPLVVHLKGKAKPTQVFPLLALE